MGGPERRDAIATDDRPIAVVFSGAGLSAESGLATFKEGALFEGRRHQDLADSRNWTVDPGLLLRYYRHRTQAARGAEPNPAHRALARLESGYRVVHLTQNVDDLLERAGCGDVRHLHGSLLHRKCERHRTLGGPCDYRERQAGPVEPGDLCPRCGGRARPDIVLFGEPVDLGAAGVGALLRDLQGGGRRGRDAFLVVGTAAIVQPAASLIPAFAEVGERFVIDPDPPHLPGFEAIRGKASQAVPALVDRLLAASLPAS